MAPTAQSAKRQRTRAALMDAAQQVFSEHGLAGATIDQVTQAAGFTRGAFYSNFASKEELMLAAMDRERQRATAAMSGFIEQFDTEQNVSIGELTATLVEVLTIGSADRSWQLARMEALPISMRHPELAAHQVRIRTQAQQDARQLVELGLQRLARTPAIDLDLLVLQVLGAADRILIDVLLEDAVDDYPDRLAGVIATLLVHGSHATSKDGSA